MSNMEAGKAEETQIAQNAAANEPQYAKSAAANELQDSGNGTSSAANRQQNPGRESAEKDSKTAKSASLSTRVVVGAGMLAALACILQYFEFSIPIMPSFIAFDLSDLPALIGAFAYGPVAGVLIELVKNIIHCAVSKSATVGELSNFILGAAFTATAGIVYMRKKTKTRALVGGILGAVIMGLISVPSNYFVVYPFYYNFMPEETVLHAYQEILPGMKSILQSLLVFNLPFTVVKGLVSVAFTMLIYKPLSPILKGVQK